MGGIKPASAAGQAMTPATLGYITLGTWTGTPGESLDAFLLGLRPVIRAWTDRTGFEACGEVAATPDGGRVGIVLTSSQSSLGCVIQVRLVPAGMVAQGRTLHTHASVHTFRASAADVVLAGGKVGDIVHEESPLHFSPTDYASGPGYLATPFRVIYQDGTPGSQRTVKGRAGAAVALP